jgi:hypothetical protein
VTRSPATPLSVDDDAHAYATAQLEAVERPDLS